MRRASPAAAVLLLACNQVNLCSWRTEAVAGADGGGPAACFSGDDCPRQGGALVCSSNAEPDLDCVRCVQGSCERVIAEACP